MHRFYHTTISPHTLSTLYVHIYIYMSLEAVKKHYVCIYIYIHNAYTHTGWYNPMISVIIIVYSLYIYILDNQRMIL